MTLAGEFGVCPVAQALTIGYTAWRRRADGRMGWISRPKSAVGRNSSAKHQ